MNQTKYFCLETLHRLGEEAVVGVVVPHLRTVLNDCLQTGLVVVQIFLQLPRLNIEHVDQDLIGTSY